MSTEHPITPAPELCRLWAQQAQRMYPHDPVAWQEHTDFRALCAELLRGLDENRHPEVRYPGHLRLVMASARAALAQAYDAGHAAGAALERNPGSLMATEAMLAANPDTVRSAHDYYTRGMEDAYRSVKDIVEGRLMTSIVIERPPAPPADGEMAELTGQLIEAANGAAAMGWDQHAQRILRAVELLQRQVLVPVPVSERLPLPEVNNG